MDPCKDADGNEVKCPSTGQRVVDAAEAWLNSAGGQVATGLADAVNVIGKALSSIIPGVGNGTTAITGVDSDGNAVSTGARVFALAGAVTEIGIGGADASRLTHAQARDLAGYLGFNKRVKDAPFHTMGQAVFSNGRQMISQDITSHAGGVWKLFDRSGSRLGTYDELLTRRIGR